MIGSDTRTAAAVSGGSGCLCLDTGPDRPEPNVESLHTILFSVGGVFFGIDAGHVAAIAAYNGEAEEHLLWAHKVLGYGGRDVRYTSPTILTIRSESGVSHQLVIDEMEEITEVSLTDIKPFPLLLEPFSLRYGLWGIIPRRGAMILLLDCHLLLKQRHTDIDSEPWNTKEKHS